ncbi:MAG: CoB--CoM heterodisulfide reductase iron-sulfur subunit B family protein [Dysgonamonadaceae bacterium]|nr:CoB--CoM heterodisulfide reductase iron-sulfur subunit B family protein [Dysgonamonadaceae bacterium]
MEKIIGFYPGCSLEGTAREYNESVFSLAKLFNIKLEPVPDWNCCGATAAHNISKKLSLSLPARILSQAETAGMKSLLVPCAACYNRLMVTQHELFENEELKSEVEEIMGMGLNSPIRVLNVIQFIQEYIYPGLQEKLSSPFGKKVACYYGCLLIRPHDVLNFDRTEDPQTMDEAMKMIGAESIDWPFKTECCGAGFSVSRTDLVAKLSGKIIKDACDRGAEAIIVACPMCHSNLDMRRNTIDRLLGYKTEIPVLYITQAIGLACGLSVKQTGIQRHIVRVDWQRLNSCLPEKMIKEEEDIHG